MADGMTRRDFLLTACAATAATTLRASARITLGYAAITWGGNDVQAIEDVSSLGFKGIQLRSSAVDRFADKPAELEGPSSAAPPHDGRAVERESSTGSRLRGRRSGEALEERPVRARDRWDYICRSWTSRPREKRLGADDYKRMGRLLDRAGQANGRRRHPARVPQPHEQHEPAAGGHGGNNGSDRSSTRPAVAGRRALPAGRRRPGQGSRAVSSDRIQVVHFKDVVSPAPSVEGAPPRPYQFVELGRGTVNLKAVMSALEPDQLSGLGHHRAGRGAGQVAHAERLRRDQPRLRRARAPPAALNARRQPERQHHDSTFIFPYSRSASLERCSCLRSLLKNPNAGTFRRQRRPDPRKPG